MPISTYTPSHGALSAKPFSPSTGVPTDGRTYYEDAANFLWRPFQNTAEVLAFLNTAVKRTGHTPVVVNTGGTLNVGQSGFAAFTGGTYDEYWFKDNTSDGGLVLKSSGGGTVDISGKVDKVQGKQLSTEDYTTVEKNKLAAILNTNTGDETQASIISKLGFTPSGRTTKQNITSGTTSVLTNQVTDIWAIINPSSVLSTHASTFPSTPYDTQIVTFSFGGVIRSGVVVTNFVPTPNSGQSVLQRETANPNTVETGEAVIYRYNQSNTTWYRI